MSDGIRLGGNGPRLCAPKEEQPDKETYLTPPLSLAALLTQEPLPERSGPIVDPCACGWQGWSIGRWAAEYAGREADLSDLHPRGGGVRQADALERSYDGAGLVMTNPPFTIASDLRARALAAGVPVLLLLPLMSLFDDKRHHNLAAVYTHSWRLGFGILPEHSDAVATAGPRADSVTGIGMPSDGRHHAWALWVPGYKGAWRGVTLERTATARALAAMWMPVRAEEPSGQRRLL